MEVWISYTDDSRVTKHSTSIGLCYKHNDIVTLCKLAYVYTEIVTFISVFLFVHHNFS